MTVRLTQEERARLHKLAGMLGSSFPGEQLNALAVIKRMAEAKKVRIDELLLSGQTEITREVVRWRESPAAKPAPSPTMDDLKWRDALREALREHELSYLLTDWEVNFASDMIARGWANPTEKQQPIVDRIKSKLKIRKEVRRTA